MIRASTILATVAACVTTLANAQATPFGLREGLSMTDLAAIAGPLSPQDGTPPTFYVAQVPRPHPELNVYAVVVGDSTGLCQVVGGRAVDSTAAVDIEADRIFHVLGEQLTAKYGAASAATKTQMRWLRISDATIPANLDAINLSLVPQPSGAILVQLRYRFANVLRCQAPALPPDPVRDAL